MQALLLIEVVHDAIQCAGGCAWRLTEYIQTGKAGGIQLFLLKYIYIYIYIKYLIYIQHINIHIYLYVYYIYIYIYIYIFIFKNSKIALKYSCNSEFHAKAMIKHVISYLPKSKQKVVLFRRKI